RDLRLKYPQAVGVSRFSTLRTCRIGRNFPVWAGKAGAISPALRLCHGSRLDLEHRFHHGMEAAEIGDLARAFDNRAALAAGRQVDIESAIARGCGVAEHVLVPPDDGIADMHIRRG